MIQVLFQNENFAVVDKQHGWLTTPARSADDPRPCLGRELQTQLNQQIFPVHRLDFEVSGITLWALNPTAHTASQKWFEHGTIHKTYQAFSRPPETQFDNEQEWKSKIVRGKRRSFEAPHGQVAITNARVIAQETNLWKWELHPLTGRPHQLRVHMARYAKPIIGDALYGGEAAEDNWIALRAVALDLSNVGDRMGLPVCLQVDDLSPNI